MSDGKNLGMGELVIKTKVKTETSNEVKGLQRDINKIVENKQDALSKSEKKLRFWRIFTVFWLLVLLVILLY